MMYHKPLDKYDKEKIIKAYHEQPDKEITFDMLKYVRSQTGFGFADIKNFLNEYINLLR